MFYRPYLGWAALLIATASGAGCAATNASPSQAEPESAADAGSNDDSSTQAAPSEVGYVGRVGIHRLNAVEYDNTVRDLIGDTTRPSHSFPPDDGAYGFTNIADSLNMSPLLVEQYDIAAENLARVAVDNPKIVRCDSEPDAACAETSLTAFMKRAWRRPITQEEVSPFLHIVTSSLDEGGTFRSGMIFALKAVLLSPSFLFRVEADPDPSSTSPRFLDDYELASRLSYFLWSSMPNDALFALADGKMLASNPKILEREVGRMLDDPRATSLIENFASSWLMNQIHEATFDETIFPSFNEDLRHAMIEETQTFLRPFVLGDEHLPDLLDAKFTFLNDRLASHYGIPGTFGPAFKRVSLGPETRRGGIFTQASVLTMTSIATRTSVVRRGNWVLSSLLCSPPPPPPPGIPPLPKETNTGTLRQRMEEHRKNPTCMACHDKMDPIGFALEKYDALGRWRELDEGFPIDTEGTLPGGRVIRSAEDLASAVKSDPRFVMCATRKMFAYALGRVPHSSDEPRIDALANEFAKDGHHLKTLIMALVRSNQFRMRARQED